MNEIDNTGDTKRKQSSGVPQMSLSEANINTVENLVLSQESDPGTHLSLREIEMEMGIPQSVHWIAKFDQTNKCTTVN